MLTVASNPQESLRAPGADAAGLAATAAAGGGVPQPQGDVLLLMENVAFAYPNGTLAIERLNLEIRAGRILGIVGPSGCGKSTLLHLLSGLGAPTSGSITRMQPEQDRHFLTMVFQQDTLLPWLRVIDNVKLYFRYHAHDKTEIDRRAKWLLELVGLADAAALYPYQLSGGMRRRVAFLSAIAPFPRVLLLDEPFSALDEPTRVAIHQEVFDILRRLSIATVIVTHDLAEAASLCDEVAILSARPGKLVVREDIRFGAQRNILSLRKEPEFLSMYGHLWELLSHQIMLGRSAGSGAGAMS
jgi:ABC-type nitrate/sulfonate/bicarbonate transport system ATPase subunit